MNRSLGLLPALALLTLPALLRYEHRPPAGHTGGFGEPTCASCHFDNPPNEPQGSISLEGLPGTYTPEERYLLSVTLQRPGLRRSGFQLSTRFSGDGAAGEQAGTLRSLDEAVEIANAAGVEYAQHTRSGTRLAEDGVATWQLEWQAPQSAGPVSLHLSANAANGDASEFGDYIYEHSASLDGSAARAGVNGRANEADLVRSGAVGRVQRR